MRDPFTENKVHCIRKANTDSILRAVDTSCSLGFSSARMDTEYRNGYFWLRPEINETTMFVSMKNRLLLCTINVAKYNNTSRLGIGACVVKRKREQEFRNSTLKIC